MPSIQPIIQSAPQKTSFTGKSAFSQKDQQWLQSGGFDVAPKSKTKKVVGLTVLAALAAAAALRFMPADKVPKMLAPARAHVETASAWLAKQGTALKDKITKLLPGKAKEAAEVVKQGADDTVKAAQSFIA
jgi:predicted metal-dependent hydrolase